MSIAYTKSQLEGVIVDSIKEALIHSQEILDSKPYFNKNQLLGDFITTIRRNFSYRFNSKAPTSLDFFSNSYYWKDIGKLDIDHLEYLCGGRWIQFKEDPSKSYQIKHFEVTPNESYSKFYKQCDYSKLNLDIEKITFSLQEIINLVDQANLLARQKLHNCPSKEMNKMLCDIDKEIGKLVNSTVELKSLNFNSFGNLDVFDESPTELLVDMLNENENNKETLKSIESLLFSLNIDLRMLNQNVQVINAISINSDKLLGNTNFLINSKKEE